MKLHPLNPLLVAGLLAGTSFLAKADQESDLLAILQSNTSPTQKADSAAQLRIVGTAQAVPALATLLSEEATAHAARHALEGIPAPEAGAALRRAFHASTGLLRIGLIDSLGWRGEPEAVPLLKPLLADIDASLASASATALGRIGGDEALAALESARDQIPATAQPALIEALLHCAERQLKNGQRASAAAIYQSLFLPSEPNPIRVAAYAGMIRSAEDGGLRLILSALEGNDTAARTAALQLAGNLQDPDATSAFARRVGVAAPELQVALLALLQARGDRAALPTALTALNSPEPSVRAAAASALGVLGDATCVTPLAKAATSTDAAEQAAARQALVSLNRGDVTATLTTALWSATPPVQLELVRALSARSDAAAVPALLELAREESSSARRAALQALGQLVDGSHLDDLVLLLVNSKSPAARDQVRGVFESLIERTPDPQQLDLQPVLTLLTHEHPEVREAVLPVSVLFGDERIRVALRQAMRDPEPNVRRAATRALCTSADPQLLPDMLNLARRAEDDNLRALALDGAVRLATDESVDLSKAQRLDALAAVFPLATRVEEKRLVLSGLSRVPAPKTLGLAEQACADSTIKPEAELACLQIAQALGTTEFATVEAALTRLIATTADSAMRTKAQALLKQLDSGWLCAGPYRIAGKLGPDLFDTVFAPEQSNAGNVAWQRAPGSADLARMGEVDLASIVRGDHCVVYAKTRIFVPKAQAVVLAIGSDDGIKLWVNGALVHANNAVRGLTPDQDRANAELREGWNELLAKITQHTVGCGFTLRVLTPEGAEPPGLRRDVE